MTENNIPLALEHVLNMNSKANKVTYTKENPFTIALTEKNSD